MKTIRQTVMFEAAPEEVYEALLDEKKHAAFTQSKAVISREVGGTFTAYEGWIEGENLELVPGKKIVQKWRGKDWPAGHFSTATFELRKAGKGTELAFTQTGVPDQYEKDISAGWKEHYWDRMREFFRKKTPRP